MLTGKKPFIANDPIAIVKKQIQEQPPRLADIAPGDYGELETVVARALAKSPADRYPSAVAMADALDAATSGRTAPEPTVQFAPITDDEPAARTVATGEPDVQSRCRSRSARRSTQSPSRRAARCIASCRARARAFSCLPAS